jgi:hypothetical protein
VVLFADLAAYRNARFAALSERKQLASIAIDGHARTTAAGSIIPTPVPIGPTPFMAAAGDELGFMVRYFLQLWADDGGAAATNFALSPDAGLNVAAVWASLTP